MSGEAVAELRGVSKGYGGRAVVVGRDLRVEDGEMVALAGPSGAGKSTLLNMIGLLEAPDEGEVRLFGRPAPRPRTRAAQRLLRDRIGYLFQNGALVDDATVAGNLELALAYAPRSEPAGPTISDALKRVGLRGMGRRPVHSLSGGERQRVAIARLMIKPCSLILADEPTGSLDEANRALVVDLLRGLNAEGRTVVAASHDAVLVEACSRAIRVG